MSDLIFIKGLALEVVIGVYESERHAAQPLILDVELAFDCQRAGHSDALADTLDYAEVVGRLRQWTAQTRHALLETLLEEMATLILAEFPTRHVRLKLHKPLAAAALGCQDVGVEILRTA